MYPPQTRGGLPLLPQRTAGYRSPVFSQNPCDNSGPEKRRLFVCEWLG